MKRLSVVLLFIFTIAQIALAQSGPTIDIVFSKSVAKSGDLIRADVYVRNAVNIRGVDIGISTDPACLRIVERQPGDFFPEDVNTFSPFSEINEYDTRLAAVVLGNTFVRNGDAIFYSVLLEVTCEDALAPIEVTVGEFTGLEDPDAEELTRISYTLALGNVNATSAELTVGPAAQATAVPTTEPTAAATDTVAPTASPTPAPVTEAPAQTNTALIILIVVVMIALIGGILYALVRYLRRH